MTSRRPTVELDRGDDCGPVVVEFCSDRECRSVIATIEVPTGESTVRPANELPVGVTFWRARSGEQLSATWQFTAGKGTRVDTWWGTLPDFNGDGRVDLAVGTTSDVVFVYYGGKDGLGASPTPLEISDPSLAFGSGLASAGDVDGDGFGDLLVAAPVKPSGGAGSRIYIYRGGSDGIQSTRVESIDFDDYHLLGGNSIFSSQSVLRGGVDINGDGYGDFIETSPLLDMPGGFTPLFGSPERVLVGGRSRAPVSNPQWGAAIGFCDWNADRKVDLIVGGSDDGSSSAGSVVHVFNGTGSRLEQGREIVDEYRLGFQVACSDFGNDGYADLVASAPISATPTLYAGEVFVYANAAGASLASGISLNGVATEPGSASGRVMVTAGDMNGDGFPELAVGDSAPKVRVMFTMREPTVADYVEIGGTPDVDGDFGKAMTSGDINGDGLADLLVSSPKYAGRGRVTIFRGSRVSRIASPSNEHLDPPEGITGFGTWLSSGL